jgi:hypothetical protein
VKTFLNLLYHYFFDIRNKKIYKNTYLNILNGYLFGKSIKGYVNLENIYKIPISGHDKIGKVTFETYKNIFKAMKMRRPKQTIREILNSAVSVRR